MAEASGPLFAYTLPDLGHVRIDPIPGQRLRLTVKAAGGGPAAATVLDPTCAHALVELLGGWLEIAPGVPEWLRHPDPEFMLRSETDRG